MRPLITICLSVCLFSVSPLIGKPAWLVSFPEKCATLTAEGSATDQALSYFDSVRLHSIYDTVSESERIAIQHQLLDSTETFTSIKDMHEVHRIVLGNWKTNGVSAWIKSAETFSAERFQVLQRVVDRVREFPKQSQHRGLLNLIRTRGLTAGQFLTVCGLVLDVMEAHWGDRKAFAADDTQNEFAFDIFEAMQLRSRAYHLNGEDVSSLRNRIGAYSRSHLGVVRSRVLARFGADYNLLRDYRGLSLEIAQSHNWGL